MSNEYTDQVDPELLEQARAIGRKEAASVTDRMLRDGNAGGDSVDTLKRWGGEIAAGLGVIVASKLLSTPSDAAIAGAYSVVQFGRAVHGYIKNPLPAPVNNGVPGQSIVRSDGSVERIISTSLQQRRVITREGSGEIDSEIVNTADRRTRLFATTGKAIGTVVFSSWLALGTPLGVEGAEENTVSGEEVAAQDNTIELLPENSDNPCAPQFYTPIPSPEVGSMTDESRTVYTEGVKDWQRMLAVFDLYPDSAVDGDPGEMTQTATKNLKVILNEYQEGLNLNLDSGIITEQEINNLVESGMWERLVSICESNIASGQ